MSESMTELTRNEIIVVLRTQSGVTYEKPSLHDYSNEQLEKLYYHSFGEYAEIIEE